MGLLQRLFGRKSADYTASREVSEWQPSPNCSTVARLGDVYGTEAAVRTVTDFISSNIASLPFKAYRRKANGDREEASGSMLSRLLTHPSDVPGVTRYALFRSLLLDDLLCDRSLALITYGHDGNLSIRRVAPRNFSVDSNSNDETVGVTVTMDGHTTHLGLPSSAVMLSTGYATNGTASPIPDTIMPLLDESRAMSEYRRNVAKNGGRIPMYAYRPKEMSPWDPDDYDDFVQYMRNYTRGGGLEGGIPTLYDGMELRTIDAFKPVDMADIDARREIAVEVANAYRISPENLGIRTGTKSNIAEYKEQLWSVELMPYIVKFEQTLNATLPEVCNEPNLYVEANVDAKLRGSLDTQYQALSTATGRAFMTTNEARRLINRPAVEGGDELVTPLNVLTGNQPSPQDGGRTQAAQQPNTTTSKGTEQ